MLKNIICYFPNYYHKNDIFICNFVGKENLEQSIFTNIYYIMIKINNDFLLRKANLSDANDLHEVLNDKAAAENMQELFIGYSEEDVRNWIESNNSKNDKLTFVIEYIPITKVIGYAEFHNIEYRHSKCTLSILIGLKEFRNNGLGGEICKSMVKFGFNELNMNRIEGRIFSNDVFSLKSALRCGFKKEGTQVQAQYRHGKYHDLVFIAILKKELI